MKAKNISNRRKVYSNEYQEIYHSVANFGDYSKEYFVLEAGTRAGMIAIQNNCVLLVKQYRFLINRASLEIPGGKVEPQETPENAAIRECLEETGLRCRNPDLLLTYHPGLDTTSNPTYLYHCNEIDQSHEPDAIHREEVLGHQWVDLEKCLEMIFTGEILDAFSIISLLAYQSQKERLQ